MDLSSIQVDSGSILVLAGDHLNSKEVSMLLDHVESLIDAGHEEVVVDCTGLTVLLSTGMSHLLRLHGKLRSNQRFLRLRTVSPAVAKALSITGLDAVFEVD